MTGARVPAPFGERVRAGIASHGPLCVGIDPHRSLIDDWGLTFDAAGARDFGLRVVEAAAGRVAFVKPQVSFFEQHGSRGIQALEDVLAAARAAGLITIADAKRGDIGSTMDAYAAAWLTPGSPLEADALTISPYLGVGALSGAIDLAYAHDKGVFVLAATSNPEATGLQRSLADDETVSARVIGDVSAHNARHTSASAWGSAGFVIGATVSWEDAGIASFSPVAPILAPGFGHQGAVPSDLSRIFGAMAPAVIASESRSILSAGSGRIGRMIADRTAQYAEARVRGGDKTQEQHRDE